MVLGAHVSTSGGIHNAIKNGTDLQCDTIQIFLRNPNQWQGKPPTPEITEKFSTAWSEADLGDVIVHDIHLSNLASPKIDVLEKSRQAFREQMELAQLLGIRYIVTHLGAHLGEGEKFGLKQLTDSFDFLFENTEAPDVMLLLETTAGQGTNLGYCFEHLRDVIGMSKYPDRFGVCLDTCHVFAAGYDMRTESDCEATFNQFDDIIGLNRLKAFHLNDAKSEYQSRVDRHEHIGEGNIGAIAFAYILNDARFAETPLIIETPQMKTMHEVNLSTLRDLKV
ncbi:MAG: deoxyribonuclease IV [Candidatus Poribacteria bacterium]|nr:deoxyribonuclease IV [Candidatus Poribacteria bacterium]